MYDHFAKYQQLSPRVDYTMPMICHTHRQVALQGCVIPEVVWAGSRKNSLHPTPLALQKTLRVEISLIFRAPLLWLG